MRLDSKKPILALPTSFKAKRINTGSRIVLDRCSLFCHFVFVSLTSEPLSSTTDSGIDVGFSLESKKSIEDKNSCFLNLLKWDIGFRNLSSEFQKFFDGGDFCDLREFFRYCQKPTWNYWEFLRGFGYRIDRPSNRWSFEITIEGLSVVRTIFGSTKSR